MNFGFGSTFSPSSPTSGPFDHGLNKVEYKNLVKRSFRSWSSPATLHTSSSSPPADPSESGRCVLLRAKSALSALCTHAASSPSKSCIGVSHSSFLRAVLGVVQGEDLASMYGVKQVNGCINVLEVTAGEGGEWFSEEVEGEEGEEGEGELDEEVRVNREVLRGLNIRGKVINVNDARHLSRGFGTTGGKGFK